MFPQKMYATIVKRLTLRVQFTLLSLCCLILTAVLAIGLTQIFQQAHNDLKSVTQHDIQEIAAAQTLAYSLEVIDAAAATYLLADINKQAPCLLTDKANTVESLPETMSSHACADLTMSQEIARINAQLYLAAHNAAYPGERTAIERSMFGIQEYLAAILLMRTEYEQGKNGARDPHLLKAYAAYQAATNVLHKQIAPQGSFQSTSKPRLNEGNLPYCRIGFVKVSPERWTTGSIRDSLDCLSNLNKDHLDNTYEQTQKRLGRDQIFSIIGCLLLLVLLTYTALRMTFITHRVFNPGLSIALLLTLVLGIGILGHLAQLTDKQGDFAQLVRDDYQDSYYVGQLKRYSMATKADKLRWLLALHYNQAQESERLSNAWAQDAAEASTLITRLEVNQGQIEEISPLWYLKTSWEKYHDLDKIIYNKALNTNDSQRISTAQLINNDAGPVFRDFHKYLDDVSAIYERRYDRTLQDIDGYLTFFTLASALGLPLLGICAAWGIFARLKDF